MRHRPGERALGAQARTFEQLLPSRDWRHRGRHRQRLLEAVAIGENHRVAADRHRDLGVSAAGIDADRGARRIRIGRPAVRLLDLKQLHAQTASLRLPAIIGARLDPAIHIRERAFDQT